MKHKDKHDSDEPLEDLLTDRRIHDRIFYVLTSICAILVLVDVLRLVEMHPYYEWEKLPGLYAVAGFTSYVGLIAVATTLRKVLMRPEDYYDQAEEKE